MSDTPKPEPQAYIGDGVYARFDGWNVWLWTDRFGGDGFVTGRHEIALEPAVFRDLVKFANKVWTPPVGGGSEE